MIKRIEMKIQRKIFYERVTDGYVVYKDIYYEMNHPENILKEKQGVTKEETIENITGFETINENEFLPYFTHGYDSISLTPLLITKKMREIFNL